MTGLILAGMLRGLIAASVIVGAGYLLFDVFVLSGFTAVALFLNLAFFSGLGVIVGLLIKDMESSAMIMNFFIMPMSFFSGTFFPVDNLPQTVKSVVYLFPLTHTNIIMRAQALNGTVIVSGLILLAATLAVGAVGTYTMSNYSE